MFRFSCIRKILYVGIFFILYQGSAAAQDVEASTYLDCLIGSDVEFTACVEAGPLSAKLADDLRRQLDDAQANLAAGAGDRQWVLYSMQIEERRFLQRLQESFDFSRRPLASLPRPIHDLANELAIRMVVLTGTAPNAALAELWTEATRAQIAANTLSGVAEAPQAMVPAAVDETASIGQSFVQVYAAAELGETRPVQPVSVDQYARIGQFQLVATESLAHRDTTRAVEVHNELVAFRDALRARGEEVSPDVDALERDILYGVLDAGA